MGGLLATVGFELAVEELRREAEAVAASGSPNLEKRRTLHTQMFSLQQGLEDSNRPDLAQSLKVLAFRTVLVPPSRGVPLGMI